MHCRNRFEYEQIYYTDNVLITRKVFFIIFSRARDSIDSIAGVKSKEKNSKITRWGWAGSTITQQKYTYGYMRRIEKHRRYLERRRDGGRILRLAVGLAGAATTAADGALRRLLRLNNTSAAVGARSMANPAAAAAASTGREEYRFSGARARATTERRTRGSDGV